MSMIWQGNQVVLRQEEAPINRYSHLIIKLSIRFGVLGFFADTNFPMRIHAVPVLSSACSSQTRVSFASLYICRMARNKLFVSKSALLIELYIRSESKFYYLPQIQYITKLDRS